jgi:SAM-dependent methyltransferase
MNWVAPPLESSTNSGLPARYHMRWRDEFERRVREEMRPNIAVLDIGSGREPAMRPDERSDGCTYAGLDLSERELALAPPDSYDKIYVADVTQHLGALEGKFDLAISWQVLEHVKPLEASLANIRTYLKPGGRFVAQFSGAFSAFGIVNQVIPAKMGVWAMKMLLRRRPDTVFPAHYDRCWYSAIEPMLTHWSAKEIVPLYRGAGYFGFAKLLQRTYMTFEDWAHDGGHRNLATHYIVDARR